MLTAVIKLPFSETTNDYLIGPEELGLDPFDIAYDQVVGSRISNAVAEALLNSSEATHGANNLWADAYRRYTVTLRDTIFLD